MSKPTRGPERFAVQPLAPARPSAARFAGAALTLLVLLIGVPLGLWLLSGPPPVPTGLPSRADLSEPLSVEAIFVVLRAVAWLAWLQFAVCTVVEVVSLARDGELPRPVPMSGRSQALARALVGTLLVGTSFLGSSGAAQAMAPVAAATSVGSIEAGRVAVGEAAVDGVVAGASAATDAADVQTASGAAPLLAPVHVGEVIAEMADLVGHKVVTVMPPKGHYHDNLWDIAERTMGDGRRWQEIYDLNKGRVQPDGQQLVLGRLILPGWVLIMPDDAQGVPRVKAMAEDAPVRGEQSQASSEAPDARDGQPPAAVAEESESALSTGGILATGGILSAVLLGALLLQRRRRRGARLSDAEAEAEVELRIGADMTRADRLDQALRALAVLCLTDRVELPQVYAATVGDAAIELRLAPPAPDAPSPWTVHDEGARWQLSNDADLPAETGPAPYPGLVCFGRDDEGRDQLLDLEALGGAVSLTGSHAVAREVVSALAVQLAYAPWADGQIVHGFGLDPSTAAVAGERFEVVDDVDHLVEEWRASAQPRPAQEVLSGRMRRTAEHVVQHLVLGERPLQESTVTGLCALMGEHDRGLGVISAVPLDGARWVIEVDDAGRMRVPLLDVDVAAVRLTAAGADALAGLFEKSHTPAPVLVGDRVAVPRSPRSGEDAHWSLAAVRVGTMGAIEVRTAGQIDLARVGLATEIVVFLALQTAPVHRNVVGASVWPAGVSAQVRDATIDRVRDWLGVDADGNHLLRETDGSRLHLVEDVAVDWHAFCSLLRRSRNALPTEEAQLLHRALHLVRGEFLAARPAQRYAWVARTRLEQVTADLVVDAAHRLVDLSLPGDPGGAVTACRAGLRLAPHSQVLWRDLMLSEAQHPDGPSPATVVAELRTVMREGGTPLEAETEALIEELMPSQLGDEESA